MVAKSYSGPWWFKAAGGTTTCEGGSKQPRAHLGRRGHSRARYVKMDQGVARQRGVGGV